MCEIERSMLGTMGPRWPGLNGFRLVFTSRIDVEEIQNPVT